MIPLPRKKKLVVTDLPRVEVEWLDAAINLDHEASLDQQTTVDKFGGLALCIDIGYLVRKTRSELVLATGLIPDDNSVRHSNTIPMRWIKKLTYLGPLTPASEEPNDLSTP